MHTDSGMTGISLSGYMPYMTVASLEMSDEPKIKYTNICKDVFPVLCIFTFVTTDFCTFLYSL